MTTITCANRNGQLIKVDAELAVPLTLSLSYSAPLLTPLATRLDRFLEGERNPEDDVDRNVLTEVGVVLRAQVSQEVSAQFQNALSRVIYVTPFGDSPGTIGLTFAANRECGEQPGGVEVIRHYLEHRLSPTNRRAATVIIGDTSFRSYLVGMQLDTASEGSQLVQGVLTFRGWPL